MSRPPPGHRRESSSRVVPVALAACLTLAACGGSEPEYAADTIYHSGPIVTVDEANPSAEALAVRDGRIVAVGSEAEVMAMRGSGTNVVDLRGRTLAPGLIDPHAHFAQFGTQAIAANLLAAPDGEVETVEDLVAALQEWAEANPDEIERYGAIIGIGYDDAILGRQQARESSARTYARSFPIVPARAEGMQKYHKAQRPYLGLANPQVNDLTAGWRQTLDLPERTASGAPTSSKHGLPRPSC